MKLSSSGGRAPIQGYNLIARKQSRSLKLARFETASVSKYAQGNTAQLVGERNRQEIAMQPPLGCIEPALELMKLPVGHSDGKPVVKLVAFRIVRMRLRLGKMP
jgi:hypothetical protein